MSCTLFAFRSFLRYFSLYLVLSGKKDPEHKLTYILRIEQTDSAAYVGKEDLTETRKVGRKYENFKIISYRAGRGYIADPKKEKRELLNTDIALGKLGEFSEYKLANAFRNYVGNITLRNTFGLSAFPFRTDTWDDVK